MTPAYLSSDELRAAEERARQLRADFIASLFRRRR